MTDLVKRLRDWQHVYPEDQDKHEGHLYEEAADRIEEFEAVVDRLQVSLFKMEKACAEWAEISKSNYQRAKAAEAALKKLEYWFDTDQEVLDAMTPDERADHMRQLTLIRDTLTS